MGEGAPGAGGPGSELSGPVLVRLSAGLWRGRGAKPDALGVAIRFGTSLGAHVPGELDLLFATFRSIWALPLAPFTTDTRDYFANTYWTVVPFEIDGLGRCHLRLQPLGESEGVGDRRDRLLRRVAEGRAEFVMEAHVHGSWRPLVRIRLEEELCSGDPQQLRFAPHASGRGVHPRGFLTETRRVVYPWVQGVRAG